MSAKRLYTAVAACAVVVYLPALWNRFAFDDLYIVVLNPVVRAPSGAWRAFAESYWPGNLSGAMYRPLSVATFALDWLVAAPAWFHAMNLAWHAGVSVAVAVLARRWAGPKPALVAGLLFAVHAVHVEAVGNVVGRSELMAALFVLLAVYAALVRGSVWWTAAALALGLLSKENAAVAPALIAWAWVTGLVPPPDRRRLVAFVASWVAVGLGYGALRWVILHGYEGFPNIAPQFLGQGPVPIRLTAVAALTDVVRVLVFPLHLQGDYSPDERTTVTSLADGGFLLGLLCLGVWAALLIIAWRRSRRVEAYGLGWIGITYLPVANLLFPHGVLFAERLLYLPSAGLALAAGAWLGRLPLPGPRLAIVVALLVGAGGARTALRAPVWRDNRTATASLIEDAPRSYRTWDYAGWEFLWGGRPDRALAAFRRAGEIYPHDARVYLAAAHMAHVLGRPALADSLLARADSACPHCPVAYRNQVGVARLRGDTAAAAFLLAHLRRRELETPP